MNSMKKLFNFIAGLFLCCQIINAQEAVKPASIGFDTVRAVPHGKVDTLAYQSKTVGVKRRTLIYTPPGFSKNKRYSRSQKYFRIKPSSIFSEIREREI